MQYSILPLVGSQFIQGPYIHQSRHGGGGGLNEFKIFLDVVRGEGRGLLQFQRSPIYFFYLTKRNKQRARISTNLFKLLCQQAVTLTLTTSYTRRECFVFHVFVVSVSAFRVGQALFFALNIYLSVRDNCDHLSLATIKISANKKL